MATHPNEVLETGAQIAPHLTVRGILGEGGMARVYEAHHGRLNASVAVKVLSLTGEQARLWGERLVREAHICARLEDTRIPRIFDVSTLEDGRPYVVMEKVTGPTLAEYLEDGPIPVSAAVGLARELLSALSVVHAAGVVHRDVKPGNIILQKSGGVLKGVRLMDFGIAHLLEEDREAPSIRVQGILGTPGYMAPEQVDPECVDGRADLYSTGVVLYEMLLGHPPFEHDDPIELLRTTLDRDVPDVRQELPACPKELAYAVRLATARRRDERFTSAGQFVRALDAVPLLTPRRRAGGALRQYAWVAAAAVGAGLWLATRSVHAPPPDEDLGTPVARPVSPEPPEQAPAAAPQLPEPETLAVDPALSAEVSKRESESAPATPAEPEAEAAPKPPTPTVREPEPAKRAAPRRSARPAPAAAHPRPRVQERAQPEELPTPRGQLASEYVKSIETLMNEYDPPKPPDSRPPRLPKSADDPLPENPF